MRKIEKILRKQADEDLEQYNNRAYLAELKEGYGAKKRDVKRAHNMRVAKYSMCAACLVAVITVTSVVGALSFGTQANKGGENEVYYSQLNERSEVSTEAALNSAANEANLIELENINVDRFYDEPSNDTLCYIAKYDDMISQEHCSFVFVTNKNYNYEFTMDEFIESIYFDHKMSYRVERTDLVDGLIFNYTVKIALELKTEKIYITFKTVDGDVPIDIAGILNKYIILL